MKTFYWAVFMYVKTREKITTNKRHIYNLHIFLQSIFNIGKIGKEREKYF